MLARRVRNLSDEQLQGMARFWVRQVLLNDDRGRQQGLDDDEFDELGEHLHSPRAELGRMLAQGKTLGVFPALHGLSTSGRPGFDPEREDAKCACYV